MPISMSRTSIPHFIRMLGNLSSIIDKTRIKRTVQAKATSDWQTIRIAFADLDAYKTSQKFRQNKLKGIGLVGIGRDFMDKFCLATLRFYSEDN